MGGKNESLASKTSYFSVKKILIRIFFKAIAIGEFTTYAYKTSDKNMTFKQDYRYNLNNIILNINF